MLNFISDATKFYIVAPANLASGGPELLHQLAYKLTVSGKNAVMFYFPTSVTNPVHENYQQYGINFVNEIEDEADNLLIVPETQTHLMASYKRVKKCIWWLSVDNYFITMPGNKGRFNRLLLNIFDSQNYLFFDKKFKEVDCHLVQSQYAYEFLKGYGIDNIYYLADYLHESFLNVNTDLSKKENIVAYNPKKGIKFTKKLINSAPHIRFVPIENMNRSQVVDLLQRAKVYIDFGFHPGKDRIPREAAFLECCVLTNKRGSALFQQDVPILPEFKFKESQANIFMIIEKIDDCFQKFDQNHSKFEDYRIEIRQQEAQFEEQIKNIFG